MSKYNVFFVSTALLLAACKVGPDYVEPISPDAMEWVGMESAEGVVLPDQAIQAEWWKSFNDPVLTQLIDEAATKNHDIRIALASVDEAKANRGISAAGFYPIIGAGASAERQDASQPQGGRTSNRFAAGLDASWEPDVFGGIRRETEAADARLDASRANYHDVMLAVFAEVSRNYFELRGLQKQIDITKRNIELLGESEKLAQSLFDNGATSAYDLTLARGERESKEAELPNLEAEMTAGIYRLSVLTGKPPEYHLQQLKPSATLPLPEDAVPIGLKSEILRRRPDIRRAERELAAATADIGIATAELFPRFPLTGSIGANATSFGDLFASGGFTYFIAQAITAPIFTGGALRANIAATDARKEQALAAYEKTLLLALEDVEASLVRYGKEWQTLKALQAVEATRLEAHHIAKLRYESGSENFLGIIDAERSLTDAREAVVRSETRVLTNLTQLYKSLGGGWAM